MDQSMASDIRPVFFISDGTGLTAEGLGQALLSQFRSMQFEKITLPYIDTVDKAKKVVEEINQAGRHFGHQPIVFDTIVNQDVRDVLANADGFLVDIFQTFLKPLERALGQSSSYSVGVSHSVAPDGQYSLRIDAVNFALDNDDGARIRYYDQADLVLIGVSRSGKHLPASILRCSTGSKSPTIPLLKKISARTRFQIHFESTKVSYLDSPSTQNGFKQSEKCAALTPYMPLCANANTKSTMSRPCIVDMQSRLSARQICLWKRLAPGFWP